MQIFRKRAVDIDSLDGFKWKEASLLRYKIANAPGTLMLEAVCERMCLDVQDAVREQLMHASVR